ncbi:hypothetical protein EDF46_0458 [Frondihabitans sp. PhB188]|uniref:multidrug transporter n=1 Tax=Frondihabitans sp. PhB188 TaxID=2485200 RepID=UPI000F4864F1|nr:multidrug transporter [Frondihabitans sp. PhB188]ROQ41087.1 hypothetical protein EDF46_0458 [Frondihabitans sp. PhB188]
MSEDDAKSTDEMSFEEKRHDQLTRAAKSDESDAAPRIVTSESPDGTTRIDVADTAKVTPGKVTRDD